MHVEHLPLQNKQVHAALYHILSPKTIKEPRLEIIYTRYNITLIIFTIIYYAEYHNLLDNNKLVLLLQL